MIDIKNHLNALKNRFKYLESLLNNPSELATKDLGKYSKEHHDVSNKIQIFEDYQNSLNEQDYLKNLLKQETDNDVIQIANEELSDVAKINRN